MTANIQERPDATATLLISANPNAALRPKPPYREEFGIDEEAYAKLPSIFTFTELPQPAVVAADCIKDYDKYLALIPADERKDLDLNRESRWDSQEAVQRFIDRSLEIAFDGKHFRAVGGSAHVRLDSLYMEIPTHSFCIGDSNGEIVDFYSAPNLFEQPLSIEARVNITRPAAVAGF